MAVKFANNASAPMSGSLSNSATSLSVQAGTGALFPTIDTAEDWFPLTLVAADGFEIVRCTGRTGDVMTIVRAQEGTVARTFDPGDRVELRVTAAAMGDILSRISTLETNLALGWKTGDIKHRPGNAADAGWVRLNGRTIGSAASGATERANADTQPLFEFLWAVFADAQCPVSGGRGASAADDFAASKTLTLPDGAGSALFALDDGGDGARGRLTDATAVPNGTTPGAAGGSQTRGLVEANLAPHSHPATTAPGGDHNHGGLTGNAGGHNHGGLTGNAGGHDHGGLTGNAGAHNHGGSTGQINTAHSHEYTRYLNLVTISEGNGANSNNMWKNTETRDTSTNSPHSHSIPTEPNHQHTIPSVGNHQHTIPTEPNHQHSITGSGTHDHVTTIGSTGSGTPFNNMPPFLALGTWYAKL